MNLLPPIVPKGIRRARHWGNLASIRLRQMRTLLLDPRKALVPGSTDYQHHARKELEHYDNAFGDDSPCGFEPSPPAWIEINERASGLIREATGNDIAGHVLARLQRAPGIRMLSLGSGPGGLELMFAAEASSAHYVCIDFNEELLRQGEAKAREQSLPVHFEKSDLNNLKLPRQEFDLVLCHASLHHVVNLEGLANEIRSTLRPGGELLMAEVVTPNGYRMWPETRKVVRDIWRTLPEQFRVNRTSYGEPRLDRDIWEGDTRLEGMECIRSGDILQALETHFVPATLVPYLCFSRRFFNSMYGWNYDLTRPLDRSILDWIWNLDCHYLAAKALRGENVFAIYRPKN